MCVPGKSLPSLCEEELLSRDSSVVDRQNHRRQNQCVVSYCNVHRLLLALLIQRKLLSFTVICDKTYNCENSM